ncbi:MAG TPA: hypothetical protein VG032_07690, partial [Acidimicrobiales bacterium]|nr:hypothetical protein [Acidimicrobiales bacterium]
MEGVARGVEGVARGVEGVARAVDGVAPAVTAETGAMSAAVVRAMPAAVVEMRAVGAAAVAPEGLVEMAVVEPGASRRVAAEALLRCTGRPPGGAMPVSDRPVVDRIRQASGASRSKA